jgi:hypothetical protein
MFGPALIRPALSHEVSYALELAMLDLSVSCLGRGSDVFSVDPDFLIEA